MTPQQKAKELVDKIFQILVQRGEHHYTFDYAKQCALIAIDEMLDFTINNCCEHQNRKYLQEVKQEILEL